MTLEILTHETISPIAHGFFTRRGGASSGVFEGLNCGLGSTDQRDIVEVNRARVAEALQVEPSHLTGVHQIHSPNVVSISEPLTNKPRADAVVTATPGLALSVLTADCMPVLFAEPHAGIVGAAHAGWRGALDGVLQATVDAMVRLGAERHRINAVIGPCISRDAYEVGPEFYESFVSACPECERFFSPGRADRLQFDLPGFGLFQLAKAKIGDTAWTGHCTFTDPERFFSYRRSTHAKEADYGRMIAAIRL